MRDFVARLGIFGELLGFLWRRKLYWLMPMMLVLFLFILLIILGNTGAAPFIYSLL